MARVMPQVDAVLVGFGWTGALMGEALTAAGLNVLEGYFSDPLYGGNKDMAAWKMIGFPGAHYDYKEWATRHGERVPLPTVGIKGRPGWSEA